MPLYIKIDFRKNGHLGAWWSRDEQQNWNNVTTEIDETSIRRTILALADQLDPDAAPVEESESVNV